VTPDAVIAGIGTSRAFGLRLELSPLRLQLEALASALADSGLGKDEIDGVGTSHGSPGGVDYDEFVLAAGLDVRWASQKWTHGRWAATTVTEAALAVQAGLASCIAVIDTTTSGRGYGRHLTGLGGRPTREGLRELGGSHGEWDVHGVDTPGVATALVARHYMDRYGATEDDLARVAMAFRAHARLNPMAIMAAKPMTAESYFAEPVIVRPFRRADFCLDSEGATCLLVCDRRRAAQLRQPAVAIAAASGIHASRDDHILFARPGLGVGLQAAGPWRQPELEVFGRAGIGPGDVDGLYVYDSFGSNLWMVLERFGFCGEGEAPGYVRDTGIGLDSVRPVNTNGGLMSEAHQSGYGHLVEMVRQLRGQAGPRQIPGATVLQWATPRGDSLILTKGG
jgi:acetyl-CoA acetyltransferase